MEDITSADGTSDPGGVSVTLEVQAFRAMDSDQSSMCVLFMD